jgi:hypothetical protein
VHPAHAEALQVSRDVCQCHDHNRVKEYFCDSPHGTYVSGMPSSSGSLATFTAMRRASSNVSTPARLASLDLSRA